MGPETSAVWAGFRRVTGETAYSEDRGYGWLKTPRSPRAVVADFTDALAGDHVNEIGNVTLTFRQDLPTIRPAGV